MSQEHEAILRTSLDTVDRFRRRAIAGVAVLFVVTVVALASLMGAAASAAGGAQGLTKVVFTSVAAQMVFVALCTVLVTLQVTRMTKTILKAIELTSTK